MHPPVLGLLAQAVHPASILSSHCAEFGCQKRLVSLLRMCKEPKASQLEMERLFSLPGPGKGVTPLVMQALSTFLAFKVGFSLTCVEKYVFFCWGGLKYSVLIH